jgi:hypothetical protein
MYIFLACGALFCLDECRSPFELSATYIASSRGTKVMHASFERDPLLGGKPYFVPIIASSTERSDAAKTFMTSKTITVA